MQISFLRHWLQVWDKNVEFEIVHLMYLTKILKIVLHDTWLTILRLTKKIILNYNFINNLHANFLYLFYLNICY